MYLPLCSTDLILPALVSLANSAAHKSAILDFTASLLTAKFYLHSDILHATSQYGTAKFPFCLLSLLIIYSIQTLLSLIKS